MYFRVIANGVDQAKMKMRKFRDIGSFKKGRRRNRTIWMDRQRERELTHAEVIKCLSDPRTDGRETNPCAMLSK